MKFIVDECTGTTVAKWLDGLGYEVYSVFDTARGITDLQILQKAYGEDFIIITNDKDFGEMVFRQNISHKGIILLRPQPDNFPNRIVLLQKLFENYVDKLPHNFVVVSNENIRIIEVK